MSDDQWGKYLRAKDPGMREKAYAWKTAIGLQKVDGLTPSDYLIETGDRSTEADLVSHLIVGGWKGGEDDPTSNPTSNPTSKAGRPKVGGLQLSPQVHRLLSVLEGEMTRAAIMKALGLKDRVTFTGSYLQPALKVGLVEMTQPDSPRSPTQRYRLTDWGRKAKK